MARPLELLAVKLLKVSVPLLRIDELVVDIVIVPALGANVVAEFTVKYTATVPPKLTAVAPVKLVPVIFTLVPGHATVGVKDTMVGGTRYVKPARVAVPPGVITDTLPDDPAPTTAVMVVAFTTVKEAAAELPKLTAVVFVKLVPVIVTVVPLSAAVGALPTAQSLRDGPVQTTHAARPQSIQLWLKSQFFLPSRAGLCAIPRGSAKKTL